VKEELCERGAMWKRKNVNDESVGNVQGFVYAQTKKALGSAF
jgi:hypothetical protein